MSPPTLLQSKPHESGAFFLLLLPAVAGYSACASYETGFARGILGLRLAWDSLRSRDTRLAPRMRLASLEGCSACASHGIRFGRGILGLRSWDARCARKIEDHVNQVDFLGGE